MQRVAIDRIKYFNIDNLQYPPHLRIDLTGKCNQNCIWCFYHGGYDKRQKVKRIKDLRKRILITTPLLDFLESARSIVRAITISGGVEPLIHPQINLILQKIINCGFKFGVITNLSMEIPDETIKLLRKAEWMRVSIDASTKETYNKIHRPKDKDSFDNVQDNLYYLQDGGKHVLGLSFLIDQKNQHEIESFVELAMDIMPDYVQFKSVYDETWGYNYTEEEIEKIDNKIKELAKFSSFKIFGNLRSRTDAMRWKPKLKDISCQISRYRVQLGADGYLYPCCMFKYCKDYRYGSIYKNTFKEILDSYNRRRVDNDLLIEKCPPCWDKPFQEKLYFGDYELEDYTGEEVDVEFV